MRLSSIVVALNLAAALFLAARVAWGWVDRNSKWRQRARVRAQLDRLAPLE